MTDEQSWTIGKLLTWTTDFLREKGADNPRLDAEVLLAHARSCPRIELYTAFEQEPDEPVRTAFRELVRRRAEGTPVAYLVGHREFFSLEFRVSPEVLIPRPETELLVVRGIDLAKLLSPEDDSEADLQIADVGTGSGVLAVCLAKHLPSTRVTAIDVSQPALEVAHDNATRHKVSERITFLCSDLFAECSADAQFDLVVSNPPYVSTAEMSQLDAGVHNHEPHLALDGGEQGMAVYRRLVPQAAARLRPGGWLLMEVGPSNAEQVEALVTETAGLAVKKTLVDLANLPRVVQALREE